MNKVARKAKQMKYAWADCIRRSKMPRCTAAEAYAEIEKVREVSGGRALPVDIYKYAKVHKSSPLHKMFQWDVVTAAREHWLETARLIMRSIVVEYIGGESHKAYFQISEKRARFYTTASEAMSRRDWAEQLLSEARSYYLAGVARYDSIKRLARVHGLIRTTFNAKKAKAA